MRFFQDTIRDECSEEDDCLKNCCLNPFVAPIFFVIFVLMAQFVLVNVVVAVLMKHLEESHKLVSVTVPRRRRMFPPKATTHVTCVLVFCGTFSMAYNSQLVLNLGQRCVSYLFYVLVIRILPKS